MKSPGRHLGKLVGFILLAMMAAVAGGQPKGQVMMVVNDLPFDRVWQATVNAVGPLTITREDKAQGLVVVESEWAAQGLDRLAYDRVRETVTVRLERFDPLTTKVSVSVEVRKRRPDGTWVQEAPAPGAEQVILTAISQRIRGRR